MNDIKQMHKQGKIRGFIQHQPKNHDNNIEQNRKQLQKVSNRSEEKDWLSWNIPYWCNEHAVTLETEYKFDRDRLFRFDFAIPALKIAIEYEGLFKRDRSTTGHTSITGVMRDIEKYNLAQRLGWRLIRLTADNYKTVLEQLNAYVA